LDRGGVAAGTEIGLVAFVFLKMVEVHRYSLEEEPLQSWDLVSFPVLPSVVLWLNTAGVAVGRSLRDLGSVRLDR
jgi:hypothetical protein